MLYAIGYYAYLSLLSVINAHDHPVAKVFVKCLIEGLPAREPLRGYDSTSFHGFGENIYLTLHLIYIVIQYIFQSHAAQQVYVY